PVLPRQRGAAVDVEVLDLDAPAARRHLAEEVADEEVARVLRAQEGHDVDVGGEAVQDLASLVGERVAALRRQVETPRAPVEDRLAEEEDAGECRQRERDAQPLRADPHRRPRHWRDSSTRSVAQMKKPAVKAK